MSTGQWKQKRFYHNALLSWKETREVTSGMQKKCSEKPRPVAINCRESHQMSAQPVLSFSRTCVSQEMCNVYEKCLSVNWFSLQSLY